MFIPWLCFTSVNDRPSITLRDYNRTKHGAVSFAHAQPSVRVIKEAVACPHAALKAGAEKVIPFAIHLLLRLGLVGCHETLYPVKEALLNQEQETNQATLLAVPIYFYGASLPTTVNEWWLCHALVL